MTQDTPAGQPDPAQPASDVDTGAPLETTTASESALTSGRPSRRTPSWLPLVLLAVLPALVVGLLVYFVAGKSGSADNAGAVEGFLRLSSQDSNVDSFKGKTPPGFPSDFPTYKDAHIVASFLIEADQGVNYFLIYHSNASTRDIFDFYRKELDQGTWQVESSGISAKVTSVSFSNPEDADVSGDLTVFHSDLEDTTVIYVSFEDLTAAPDAKATVKDFKPETSFKLPDGWPSDVPLYDESKSIVIESFFRRSTGSTQYYVSFITRDSQSQVLNYYEDQFKKKSWTVTDSTGSTSGFSLGLDFHDANSSLQGSVMADAFPDDKNYTQVDILLQVDRNRTPTRGN